VLFRRIPFGFDKTFAETAEAARNGEFDEPECVPIGRTVCCARETYANVFEYGGLCGYESDEEPENAEYYFGDDPDWRIEDQPWYIEEDPENEEDWTPQ